MRLIESVREGLRDIASGATAPVRWAVAVAAAVGVPAVASAAQETADIRSATAWVAAGAATWIEDAPGRIDASSCEALADSPSVRAVGAIRRAASDIGPAALPRASIATYEVSPGFLRVVDAAPRDAGTGLVVRRSVADAHALDASTHLETTAGALRIGGVYAHPSDGRAPELAHAALAVSPIDEPFDACWATIWPDDRAAIAGLIRSVGTAAAAHEADDAARPRITQLNTSLGHDRAAVALMPEGVAPTCAAAGGAIVGLCAARRRRLVLASDRHAGITPPAQILAELTSTAVWSVVGAMIGVAAIVMTTADLSATDAIAARAAAFRIIVVGTACALLGSALGVLAVRERSLFRYWKSR
jgi:hypothetical protein